MSTAIIPKSEMRKNFNISVGYGEVPAFINEGLICWGLPGRRYTYSEQEALDYAIKLDREIRNRMRNVRQLDHI